MKNSKSLLFIIYLLFIGISLIFIFFTDAIFDQIGIQKTLDFLKYWAVFGLILFLFQILISNFSLQNRRKEIDKLQKENNSLKAKIYDIENRDRDLDKSLKSFGNSLKSDPNKSSDKDDMDSI